MVKNLSYMFAVFLVSTAACGTTAHGGREHRENVDCSIFSSTDEKEDCQRNAVRSYPIQAIKSIKITGSGYWDSDGKPCATGAGPRLTRSKIRYFLKNSLPVSQMAVMNLYGERGECSSDNAKITFSDGRVVHFSLSSEGKVGYLSPLVNGQETDVFFYYCERCSR